MTPLSLPNWLYGGIAVVAALAGSYALGRHDEHAAQKLHSAKAETKEVIRTVYVERKGAEAVQKVDAKVTAAKTRIEYVDRIIQEKVPVYVPQDPRNPNVPLGVVRLLNAAAAGSPAPEAAGAAELANGAESATSWAELTAAVSGNYAACLTDREKLAGWESFYADVRRDYGPQGK